MNKIEILIENIFDKAEKYDISKEGMDEMLDKLPQQMDACEIRGTINVNDLLMNIEKICEYRITNVANMLIGILNMIRKRFKLDKDFLEKFVDENPNSYEFNLFLCYCINGSIVEYICKLKKNIPEMIELSKCM